MLAETEEEYFRRGNFKRLFPQAKTVDKYSKYFETTRYNNVLTWKFL
jgi:hypothetical protein